uniref:Uncharacterized protein n=1 Tax=Anopheles minimus TaxID=112268 RepID=A0A182W7L5_9DIPT
MIRYGTIMACCDHDHIIRFGSVPEAFHISPSGVGQYRYGACPKRKFSFCPCVWPEPSDRAVVVAACFWNFYHADTGNSLLPSRPTNSNKWNAPIKSPSINAFDSEPGL